MHTIKGDTYNTQRYILDLGKTIIEKNENDAIAQEE
jgi:hypothetical protein